MKKPIHSLGKRLGDIGNDIGVSAELAAGAVLTVMILRWLGA